MTKDGNGQERNMNEDAQESSPIQAILIPYIMLMLLFMMIMMSAVPLLNSVMEEKTERIAEGQC